MFLRNIFNTIMGNLYRNQYYNQGVDYLNQKNFEEAIIVLTKAIKIDQKYKEAYNNRGIAYGELNRHEDAINDYTEAIKIDDKYLNAYINRGAEY